MSLKADVTLDAKGLACPMPIVKTKKAMNDLIDGQILEVAATDKGSKADIAAWSESVGHQYIGTTEEGDVLKHYIRKCSNETIVEKHHEQIIKIDGLLAKVVSEGGMILDVREEVEYAFGHIEGAKSIPMGNLEARMNELEKDQAIYVICRTGKRSDLAAQKLVSNGFEKVWNVMPGMTEWTGEIKKNNLNLFSRSKIGVFTNTNNEGDLPSKKFLKNNTYGGKNYGGNYMDGRKSSKESNK